MKTKTYWDDLCFATYLVTFETLIMNCTKFKNSIFKKKKLFLLDYIVIHKISTD